MTTTQNTVFELKRQCDDINLATIIIMSLGESLRIQDPLKPKINQITSDLLAVITAIEKVTSPHPKG